MQQFKAVIFKQYRLPFIGFIRSMMAYLAFYLAPINFVLIMITAWHTTISPWAVEYAPWLSIWLFFLIMISILAIGLVVEYKLILPSHITFTNIQTYTHPNPIRDDIAALNKEIKELKEKLDAKEEKEATRI